ncbi:response regulator transcription factor [Nonomuraea sp. K274]|uniref:Response regulator transcription factor n=1 Tax=Nonomuraea cypriaca TaxID=1187855 RepID=A0A931A890_9ACTN|nr:response regulator transcription factor [Nonomuraea cypriaca]MBF8188086.1 response regulator transcription factor [Nonomuraea cypriaca]
MIEILIAEHLHLVRGGLLAVLGAEPGFRVIGEAGCADQAVRAAAAGRPDVAIVNIDLPGQHVLARLTEQVPECGLLVLSAGPSPAQVRKTLAGPALGFMSLCVEPERLVEGVRQVAAGCRAIEPELAISALHCGTSPLTRRELDVLRIAAGGARSTEIADELFLSVGTVRNHLSRIMCKTGARNRLDAVRIASDCGWL